MWTKTPQELCQALSAPFSSADIEWRVSATNQDKTRGLAVPYVTNRAIQNRLDHTVGIDGWHNDFVPWKGERAQLCGISIYFPDLQTWITKWDGADDSDIESVKGGLSDSMKRAAVEWGVGRYLYGMTQVWVMIEQRGKGYVICDSERPRLDSAHEQWVQSIRQRKSGQGAPAQPMQNNVPAQPVTGQTVPTTLAPAAMQGPQPQNPQQAASQPQFPPKVPAQRRPPVQQTGNPAPAGDVPNGYYLVMGAVLKPTMSGASRTSLQVRDSTGNVFQAFTRAADNRLAPGVLLTNAQFTSQHSNGVTFFVLESYQVVDCRAQQAA